MSKLRTAVDQWQKAGFLTSVSPEQLSELDNVKPGAAEVDAFLALLTAGGDPVSWRDRPDNAQDLDDYLVLFDELAALSDGAFAPTQRRITGSPEEGQYLQWTVDGREYQSPIQVSDRSRHAYPMLAVMNRALLDSNTDRRFYGVGPERWPVRPERRVFHPIVCVSAEQFALMERASPGHLNGYGSGISTQQIVDVAEIMLGDCADWTPDQELRVQVLLSGAVHQPGVILERLGAGRCFDTECIYDPDDDYRSVVEEIMSAVGDPLGPVEVSASVRADQDIDFSLVVGPTTYNQVLRFGGSDFLDMRLFAPIGRALDDLGVGRILCPIATGGQDACVVLVSREQVAPLIQTGLFEFQPQYLS